MERKLVGWVALAVSIMTITYVFLLMYFPDFHSRAVAISDRWYKFNESVSVMELMEDPSAVMSDESESEELLLGHQFRLELPKNVSADKITVDNDYMNRNVKITIPGIGSTYYRDYGIIGKSDNIADIVYESENMVGVFDIALDHVKEVQITSRDQYVYIDILDPHEAYDYVVVVDAGHGGNAPGAVKQGVSEKKIDLELVLALKEVLDKSEYKIKTYYTRTTDESVDLDDRVALANDVKADAFISIHNNSTKSGHMSAINGTEVMFHEADASGKSLELAQICLDHLLATLGSKNKGTVVGDEIRIIRNAKVPVALIEVGFMTNQAELKKLQSADYQAQCAQAVYGAILEFLNLGEKR